ncbi:MAG: response regulator [Deltaproteobacteria bacterium]|nr:response regulator [Deltaproteobacteria bacterium]
MNRDFTKAETEKIFSLVSSLVGTKRLAKQQSRLILSNIKKRIRIVKSQSLEEYLQYTKQNSEENRFLISNLTVHTTYWFREKVNLDLFGSWLDNVARNKKVLRGISVGCSTGQEVFSAALMMEKRNIDYTILGIDIDPISVDTGQRGIYPESELSSIPHEYIKYILIGSGRTQGLFTLSKEIRDRCTFEVKNAEKMNYEKDKYDFILCRNMLIYFEEDQVNEIIQKLSFSLATDGMLILGISESLTKSFHGIEQLKPAVFRKNEGQKILSKSSDVFEKRILVIEDSKTIQSHIAALLGSEDHKYTIVDTLKKADDQLDQQSFSVISLDVNLPDGNGLTWLSEKRKHGLRLPVAVLSSISEEERSLFLDLFRSGVTEFFPKDILGSDSSQYQLFVRTFLGKSNLRQNSSVKKQSIVIVDDDDDLVSLFKNILNSQNYEVHSFSDSLKALAYLKEHQVDGLLTDYRMPDMDGLELIRKARLLDPAVPVMILSGLIKNRKDIRSRTDIKVLDKPVDEVTFLNAIADLLKSKPERISPRSFQKTDFPCIVIGASTGGPQTLKRILEKVPANVPPLVIVQHIPEKFQEKFFVSLAADIGLRYRIVDREMKLENECLYVSDPGKHVCIRQRGPEIIAFPVSEPDGSGHCPSVNQLFRSAAQLSDKCLAILLTGMGSDGASAMKEMRNKGHITVAQDESSIVYGMPRAAVESGGACFTGSDWDIQTLISGISAQYHKKPA